MKNRRRRRVKGLSHLDSMPIATVVGEGISVVGDVRGEGVIRIDGSIDGDVRVSEGVILGERGRVQGSLDSSYVIIYGEVVGDIRCQELLLRSSGRVTGDILTGQVEIEKGGVYNGRVQMEVSAPDASESGALGSDALEPDVK